MIIATPATAATELAQPDHEVVSYHGVSFPKAIGDARRLAAQDAEAAGSGAGFEAAYSHGSAVTTVKIYKWTQARVPDDLRGPVVTREFNSFKHAILSTRSAGQEVRPGREFTVSDGRDVPRLVCAPYVMAQGHMSVPDYQVNFQRDYIVCLGAVNGEFIKTGSRVDHLNYSVTEARRFLDSLARHVWK
ncbi:MAG: hypothetical protein HY244_01830 [Rhizobiales bacterium]|nr:hypothetical protein [Hyphomicrobiales bacterium]